MLQVLKRYPWLWQMNKPVGKRPRLYIVNLQWTPKDDAAVLKINGRCDQVMHLVMKHLGLDVPRYTRAEDPIFAHSTPLLPSEMHTTSQPFLQQNESLEQQVKEEPVKADGDDQQAPIDDTNTSEGSICPEDRLKINKRSQNDLKKEEEVPNKINKSSQCESEIPVKKEEYYDMDTLENSNHVIKIKDSFPECHVKEELVKAEDDDQQPHIGDTNTSEGSSCREDRFKINKRPQNDLRKEEEVPNKINKSSQHESEKPVKKKKSDLNSFDYSNQIKMEDSFQHLAPVNKTCDASTCELKEPISKENKSMDTLVSSSCGVVKIDYPKSFEEPIKEQKVINCDTNSLVSSSGSVIKTENCFKHLAPQNKIRKPLESREEPVSSCSTSPLNKTSNMFSIDSILRNDVSNNSANLVPTQTKPVHNAFGNLQTLMAYYELANTMLQNQMLGFVTTNLYPLQTSLLYPGLHSIINPAPILSCDFTSVTLPNQVEPPILHVKKEPEAPAQPSCDFCNKTYKSVTCLYYPNVQPKFEKELYRFSKTKNCNTLLVCVCCDYTTEEEEESDSESKIKKKTPSKKQEDVEMQDSIKQEDTKDGITENIDQTNVDSNAKKNNKVQAGWFGKGYRKNRRTKKR